MDVFQLMSLAHLKNLSLLWSLNHIVVNNESQYVGDSAHSESSGCVGDEVAVGAFFCHSGYC